MRTTIFLICVAALLGAAAAGDVGFRSDGRGYYPGATPPLTFSPEEAVVWAAALPAPSNASPVVLADRVITCAEPDALVALDKATGRLLWSRANPVSEALGAEEAAAAGAAPAHPDCGMTSATPASDGEGVFAVFGTGVVAACDLDGKRRWIRCLEKPRHPWGHGASPVLCGGRLIVQLETLLALDPATGKEVWRQPAETWANQKDKRFGTPAAARIGDVPVIVTPAGRAIRASDGAVLVDGLPKAVCASPLVVDGVVYLFGEGGGAAVRLPASPEGKPEPLWKATTVKEAYYASPALHDGLLYVVSQRGHFSAFDAATGEEVYREKILLAATEKVADAAFASVTLAGPGLFVCGVDGSVVVVKPGRKFEVLARNRVETALRSTAVFEGSRMYLRAPGHLYCFGK